MPFTLRLSPWEKQLATPEIVATSLLPLKAHDEAETLRQRRLRAKEAVIPATLAKPQVRWGLRLELPSGLAATPVAWRDAQGQRRGEARAGALHELELPATAGVAATSLELTNGQGRVWARVRISPAGPVQVLLAEGVRAGVWLGIVRAPSEADWSERAQWRERLRWQHEREQVLPPGWERNDEWASGRGHRLDLPLREGRDEGSHRIRLIDTTTGWAAAGRLDVRYDEALPVRQ